MPVRRASKSIGGRQAGPVVKGRDEYENTLHPLAWLCEDRSRMTKIGNASMLVAAGFLLQALSSPALAQETKIRPGMIIQFKSATPGCFTREGLQEYLTYLAKRENATAKAMLFESGGNKCVTLPPTRKLKVISVETNPGSGVALLQVVGAAVTTAEGCWTVSTGAVPVSQ
jgi:hypothetical protein